MKSHQLFKMASSMKNDRDPKHRGREGGGGVGAWSRQIEFQYGNELKIRKHTVAELAKVYQYSIIRNSGVTRCQVVMEKVRAVHSFW